MKSYIMQVCEFGHHTYFIHITRLPLYVRTWNELSVRGYLAVPPLIPGWSVLMLPLSLLTYKLLTLRMRSWSKIIWDKLSHCSCWGSAAARTTPHWSRGRMLRSSPCRWFEERHWFRILKYFFINIFRTTYVVFCV